MKKYRFGVINLAVTSLISVSVLAANPKADSSTVVQDTTKECKMEKAHGDAAKCPYVSKDAKSDKSAQCPVMKKNADGKTVKGKTESCPKTGEAKDGKTAMDSKCPMTGKTGITSQDTTEKKK